MTTEPTTAQTAEPTTTLIPIAAITIRDRQRKHPITDAEVSELAESIRTTGSLVPIIVDESNVLLAGECRIRAHLLLGRTHIRAEVRVGLTDWDRKVIELAENIHRYSLDHRDRLAAELELHRMYVAKHGKQQTLGGESKTRNVWKITDTAKLLGVSSAETSNRLKLAEAMEKDPTLGDFKNESQAMTALKRTEDIQSRKIVAALAVLATPQQTTQLPPTGTGDLAPIQVVSFTHDLATLYHSECKPLIKTLPDNSISCLLTDPPWQVDFDSQFGSKTDIGLALTEEMLTALKPKLQDGALCWMFCATKHLLPGTVYNIIKGCGYTPIDLLIWDKGKIAHSSVPLRELKKDYEPCIFFSKNKARDLGRPTFAIQTGVVLNKTHPAQKSETLIANLIAISTVEGETVIDPFAGSAVVLQQANLLRRRSIGCEKVHDWYATGITNLVGGTLDADSQTSVPTGTAGQDVH